MTSRKAELEDEGKRLGAEFQLGRCTGQWRSRYARPRFIWGVVILILIQGGGFISPFGFTGLGRVVAACVVVDLLVLGVAMVALPPRTRQDRLFRYDGGVILMAEREPEPRVLRWADLVSVTRKMGYGYEGSYLKECELRDRTGRVLVMRDALSPGIELVAARADGVMARREYGEPLQDEILWDEVLQDDAGTPTSTAPTLEPPRKRGKQRWPLLATAVIVAIEGAVIGYLATTAAPAPPPPVTPASTQQAP
jgi:hypothetical protein